MNEYLVNSLKKGRADKGLKQSEVAKMLGLKGNTLSNYENGVTEPDIDTFCNLCDIYDMDFSYVLGEAYGLGVQGEEFTIRPSEIECIKKYRDLDSHGREMVDFTLLKEWERSVSNKEKDNVILMETTNYTTNAAHADDYASAPDELKKQEEDIMDDENF